MCLYTPTPPVIPPPSRSLCRPNNKLTGKTQWLKYHIGYSKNFINNEGWTLCPHSFIHLFIHSIIYSVTQLLLNHFLIYLSKILYSIPNSHCFKKTIFPQFRYHLPVSAPLLYIYLLKASFTSTLLYTCCYLLCHIFHQQWYVPPRYLNWFTFSTVVHRSYEWELRSLLLLSASIHAHFLFSRRLFLYIPWAIYFVDYNYISYFQVISLFQFVSFFNELWLRFYIKIFFIDFISYFMGVFILVGFIL